jgi:hypothetical protein
MVTVWHPGCVQERIRQKKEYDIVVNERDILGTQVGQDTEYTARMCTQLHDMTHRSGSGSMARQ